MLLSLSFDHRIIDGHMSVQPLPQDIIEAPRISRSKLTLHMS